MSRIENIFFDKTKRFIERNCHKQRNDATPMTNLKVLFITRKWAPAIGGMETYSVQLTEALSERTRLQVLALPGRSGGSPPSIFAIAAFLIRAVWVALRVKGITVLHIGDIVLWPAAFAFHMKNPTARVFVTIYGLDMLYGLRSGLLPKIYRMYIYFGRLWTSSYTQVIAISHATARAGRRCGFKDVEVIPLGIKLRDISYLGSTVEPYVLFVGRLVKRKGAAWFAERVMPLLPAHIEMYIAGSRWDDQEWARLCDNPRVKYLGLVSDEQLVRLRQHAIAILMPNIVTHGKDMEGFGLTALEAAVDGGILCASNIEGITDAVVDGETGFLLNEGDPGSWAQKIEELMSWSPERRRAFIENARKVVAQRYSWTCVAQKTHALYCGETIFKADLPWQSHASRPRSDR